MKLPDGIRLDNIREQLQALADEYGGRVLTGIRGPGRTVYPSYERRRFGGRLRLTLSDGDSEGPTGTTATFEDLPADLPQLTISPWGLLDSVFRLLGLGRKPTGYDELDRNAVFACTDEGFLAAFLTEKNREHVQDLLTGLPGAPASVRAASRTVVVSVPAMLVTSGDLRLLHRRALGVTLGLVDTASGVFIAELSWPEGASIDIVCPVCAVPLVQQLVAYCRCCEAPHHLDCWKYNGGCAMYGCPGCSRALPRSTDGSGEDCPQ
ncbi:MAG: hypothetical protein HY815_10745 [Candidatus Riflebacteria bacterium]|nr:hypothetical protein [Candidatus Riflebacteria bacterium]